jgi:6-phosphogluconolactonase
LAGADAAQLPAAGVHGIRATRWLLDDAAASELPGRAG